MSKCAYARFAHSRMGYFVCMCRVACRAGMLFTHSVFGAIVLFPGAVGTCEILNRCAWTCSRNSAAFSAQAKSEFHDTRESANTSVACVHNMPHANAQAVCVVSQMRWALLFTRGLVLRCFRWEMCARAVCAFACAMFVCKFRMYLQIRIMQW